MLQSLGAFGLPALVLFVAARIYFGRRANEKRKRLRQELLAKIDGLEEQVRLLHEKLDRVQRQAIPGETAG